MTRSQRILEILRWEQRPMTEEQIMRLLWTKADFTSVASIRAQCRGLGERVVHLVEKAPLGMAKWEAVQR